MDVRAGASRGRHGPVLLSFSLLLLLATLAGAQERAAGIVGQVRDEGGGVLPGVTVTATSPALQIPQLTSITNELGEYRLTPLPIGTYTIRYDLSGFQSVRQDDVRLTVGFVAKIDVVLKVGALAETITVSGVSPVVDVTATATTTQLTREQLELTPTSRSSYVSVLVQAPGVRTNLDVGGSQAVENPQFRAFGQAAESWQTLEGVLTTSQKNSQSGNFVDFGALEEVSLVTVGGDAETPTRGIQVVAVAKSGGNQFHGRTWWHQTSGRLQSSNIDAPLRAQGITSGGRVQRRWNVDADLGGRIIPSKLWFYGGVSQVESVDEVLGVFKPDGSPATSGPHLIYFNSKLSYQATNSNRFVFFHQWGDMIKRVPASQVTQFNPWESRVHQTWDNHTAKGEWQAVHGNSVTSLQYGYRLWDPLFLGVGDKLATTDIATQLNTGTNWSFHGDNSVEFNHHAKGSVSWYRSDLFAGNHEFKAGFDYVSTTHSRNRQPRGAAGDYRLVFNNGAPFGIDTLNAPTKPLNVDHYLGMYGKDQWVIRRRLTLNVGVRYARDNGFVPEQCREAGNFAAAECFAKVQFKIFNSIAPRISASYDLTGDGKTAIKGSWGRFDHKRDIDPELTSANRNVGVATNWRWRDLNNDRQYQAGEVNLDPNGSDFFGFSSVGTSSGSADAVPNPDEKQPKQDQVTVALERELIRNLAVRITGVYARGFNNYRLQNNRRPYSVYNVSITRADPGPDGRAGTADDPGSFLTYYEYPDTLIGRQFQQGMLINDPNYIKTYKSIELAATKRLSRGWQFLASYSATKTDEPIITPGGALPPAFDPNAEIKTANHTWEWLGKASGTYMFPANLIVSTNFEHRSGNPYARTVLFTGGRTIPSIVLNVEPIGTRRLPSINLWDLRAEKRFQLTGGRRLAVLVDLFNVLNINTATSVNTRSGATFGRTMGIVSPRILELGASFDF